MKQTDHGIAEYRPQYFFLSLDQQLQKILTSIMFSGRRMWLVVFLVYLNNHF